MANERKTERIVRNHFEKYTDILIEEQKSDNPKIDKLLKNASKRGDRHGSPEFIISYNTKSEFIIVIECKADVRKHQSASLDKYAEYAVDGSLLYAAFLAKEFDVLAISVSGENLSELRISHFLHIKGEPKAIPYFGDVLLSPENYYEKYRKSPEKFNQEYSALLAYSKTLSDTLHSIKIKASQRSLLISGVLIALTDKGFAVSYKHHSPDVLAKLLVSTVVNQLKKANLSSNKIDNLENAYSFLRTHTALSTMEEVLSDLIQDIDKHINSFVKTYQYFDVLGQFYIEFLRYANSDKGLGIVLTPPHITELFCELTDLNKDSVVFDNCTGTGGFLISAMSKMVADAKGDNDKIRHIKEKQLIGVEYLDDIFALACSNMFIHEDGKTNIINGDCFDKIVIEQAKQYNPEVGFLNPPYKAKKTDIEELEFVINNLNALRPNGTCIAIVPMSCVLATKKGSKLETKRRILQKHTLEAVFSMPDELFFNSDVAVVTAVLVLTAHRPHPSSKQTFFGYFKDDGFVKRKNRGRIDALNKWENVKLQWVDSFRNRISKPGLSVTKVVRPEDEWCAEAYMDTDYSMLNEDHFKKVIRDYSSFLVRNDIIQDIDAIS
ncbi:class I SAM-dependent DNA methyltransferase [Dyadobacter sp. CY323]|uniref:HsdM family class I SAM-dependent methyltransferase n=1 Tax=Dyadobacter sp. CY323 TaxID=2907302 RepID=UPI001F339900|nr:N-6 DNA methylase [Dyadobacter sp. CY323]MCE6988141.1 SAM-dependent methyltransferase [Dyadobacter sp. CY323]